MYRVANIPNEEWCRRYIFNLVLEYEYSRGHKATWSHSKGHFAGANHIEGAWSSIKRYMRKLYGNIPTNDLQLILNEWEARHNKPELFSSVEEFLQSMLQR